MPHQIPDQMMSTNCPLFQSLNSKDLTTRLAATIAVGKHAALVAVKHLMAYGLEDTSPLVRAATLTSLRQIETEHKCDLNISSRLIRSLSDTSKKVVLKACEEIANYPYFTPKTSEYAAGLLEDLANSPDFEIAAAAIVAFSNILTLQNAELVLATAEKSEKLSVKYNAVYTLSKLASISAAVTNSNQYNATLLRIVDLSENVISLADTDELILSVAEWMRKFYKFSEIRNRLYRLNVAALSKLKYFPLPGKFCISDYLPVTAVNLHYKPILGWLSTPGKQASTLAYIDQALSSDQTVIKAAVKKDVANMTTSIAPCDEASQSFRLTILMKLGEWGKAIEAAPSIMNNPIAIRQAFELKLHQFMPDFPMLLVNHVCSEQIDTEMRLILMKLLYDMGRAYLYQPHLEQLMGKFFTDCHEKGFIFATKLMQYDFALN